MFSQASSHRNDGYYGEQGGLIEYCRREGITISETNGYMVTEPRVG